MTLRISRASINLYLDEIQAVASQAAAHDQVDMAAVPQEYRGVLGEMAGADGKLTLQSVEQAIAKERDQLVKKLSGSLLGSRGIADLLNGKQQQRFAARDPVARELFNLVSELQLAWLPTDSKAFAKFRDRVLTSVFGDPSRLGLEKGPLREWYWDRGIATTLKVRVADTPQAYQALLQAAAAGKTEITASELSSALYKVELDVGSRSLGDWKVTNLPGNIMTVLYGKSYKDAAALHIADVAGEHKPLLKAAVQEIGHEPVAPAEMMRLLEATSEKILSHDKAFGVHLKDGNPLKHEGIGGNYSLEPKEQERATAEGAMASAMMRFLYREMYESVNAPRNQTNPVLTQVRAMLRNSY